MVSLFNKNIPATRSPVESAEIRDNFNAIYDKVKTLEPRAQEVPDTSLQIIGGPCYFREGASQALKYVRFQTEVLSFENSFGYKSYRDTQGRIQRSLITQRGVSSFETQGTFLEVLVSLQSNGKLVFTESISAQNTRLSSPFNIYFSDSEIPIALVFLEKDAAGVLQPIEQTDVIDVRPVVTSAFQNNQQITTIESLVEDNTARLDKIQSTSYLTSNLALNLPSLEKLQFEGTEDSNTLVEILSGSTISPSGQLLKYGGGYLDFELGATADSTKRIISANTPLSLGGNAFNKALITLSYDSASNNYAETAKINTYHGLGKGSIDDINSIDLAIPSEEIPLGLVIYRINATGSAIIPIISLDFIGTTRASYSFPIISISGNTAEVDLSDYSGSKSITSDIFQTGGLVDLFDDQTRPSRRQIASGSSYNSTTRILTLVLEDSVHGLSLDRNPQVKSIAYHKDIIEDLRTFVGR